MEKRQLSDLIDTLQVTRLVLAGLVLALHARGLDGEEELAGHIDTLLAGSVDDLAIVAGVDVET